MSATTYRQIGQSVRRIDAKRITNPKAVTAESIGALIGQLLQVYDAISPLLDAFATFGAMRPAWSRALTAFRRSVEALRKAWTEEDDTPKQRRNFKAGKDL